MCFMISRRWTWDVLCLDLGVDVLADCYWAMPFSVIVALGWAWMFWFYDHPMWHRVVGWVWRSFCFERTTNCFARYPPPAVTKAPMSTSLAQIRSVAGRWCLRPLADTAHRLLGWLLDLIFVLFGNSA